MHWTVLPVTHLLRGDIFIDDCLIPLRIQAFLYILSSPLVLSTEFEQRRKHYIRNLLFLSVLVQKTPTHKQQQQKHNTKPPNKQKSEKQKEKNCISHFWNISGLEEDNDRLWVFFFSMLSWYGFLKHLFLTLQQASSAYNRFNIKHQSAHADMLCSLVGVRLWL